MCDLPIDTIQTASLLTCTGLGGLVTTATIVAASVARPLIKAVYRVRAQRQAQQNAVRIIRVMGGADESVIHADGSCEIRRKLTEPERPALPDRRAGQR